MANGAPGNAESDATAEGDDPCPDTVATSSDTDADSEPGTAPHLSTDSAEPPRATPDA